MSLFLDCYVLTFPATLLTQSFRRDLIALLCFVEPEGINSQVDLYLRFIQILTQQVTSMDADLLEVRAQCFDRFHFVGYRQI